MQPTYQLECCRHSLPASPPSPATCLQSQVTGLGLVHMRSGVVRTLEQQAALDLFDSRLVTARLRGFVFFGSANAVGAKLHQARGRA